MNEKSNEFFTECRRSFERTLANSLAALEGGHYPPSLLKSLGLILDAPGRPMRGLPLLAGCLAAEKGCKPREQALVAVEALLRGFLLLAEMGLEQSCRPEKAVARSLEKDFSRAHLLLSADTLFTWPLELVAGETDKAGNSLVEIFSGLLGAGGLLHGLDSARPDLEGLLEVEPVEALIRALTAGRDKLEEPEAMAARWIYLREIESWFGVTLSSVSLEMQRIEKRLDEAAGNSSSEPAVKQVAALIRFFNKPQV